MTMHGPSVFLASSGVATVISCSQCCSSLAALLSTGEEAFETAIAAVQEDKGRLVSEAADLLYHLLVVLKARGIALADVEAELEKRTAQSGHAEKASRPRG